MLMKESTKGLLLPPFAVLHILSNIVHGDCEHERIASLVQQLDQCPEFTNTSSSQIRSRVSQSKDREQDNILQLLIIFIIQLCRILLPEIDRFMYRCPGQVPGSELGTVLIVCPERKQANSTSKLRPKKQTDRPTSNSGS